MDVVAQCLDRIPVYVRAYDCIDQIDIVPVRERPPAACVLAAAAAERRLASSVVLHSSKTHRTERTLPAP